MDEKIAFALQNAELRIIKRDFDLMKKIGTQIQPEVALQLTPYIALYCYEVIEYMKRKGYDIDIEQTSRYSIKDIRQKAKFFDLSINKLLQSVDNVDNIQNQYFIQLMRYPEFGHWNVHNNLGIYFDDENNIVSNSHYAYYVFQDDRSISKPKDEVKGYDVLGEEVRAFAYDMGTIIGSISSGLSSISDFIVADFNPNQIVLHMQDYNTNCCMTDGNDRYKTIRLFLLHVLSSIGLLLFVLKKAIIRETGLLLRFEYITYHYALLRLDGLRQFCNSHKEVVDDKGLIEMLNCFDFKNEDGIRKTAFRNCAMHFALIDNKGNPLISEDKLNLAIPYCGLVESQFEITYDEYKNRLENRLMFLYQKIKDYLSIDMAI